MTNERLSELIGIQNRINNLENILIVLDSPGVTIDFSPNVVADDYLTKCLIPDKKLVSAIKDCLEKELNRLTKEFEDA